jgi:outer membrane murein-binding lipoprotein Lpp
MRSLRIIAVAVPTLLFLAGCTSTQQPSSASNAIKKQGQEIATLQEDVSLLKQQLAQVQKTQGQSNLSRQCALDAEKWYKKELSNGFSAPVTGGGHVYEGVSGYQVHYSKSQHGCFALVHKVFLSTRAKTSVGTFIQTTLLYNVYENSEIGGLTIKFPSQIGICEVANVQCKTKQEWIALARPYLNS